MRKSVTNVLVAVLGLTTGALVVNCVSGPMRPREIERHHRAFAEYRDSLDVVFIGSSRTGCNVVPAVLEATTSLRSYSYWSGGLTAAETREIVREMLKEGTVPELIVVESLPADGRMPAGHRQTDRSAWYRTLHNFPMIWEDGGDYWEHIKLLGVRVFRIGKAREMLRRPLVAPVRDMGYEPPPDGVQTAEQVVEFERWKQMLSKGIAGRSKVAAHQRFHEQILRIVDGRARVIFLLPPGTRLSPSMFAGDPNVLAMNDPDRFPQVFDSAQWRDPVHLSTTGAVVHSEALAAELMRYFPARLEI